jgi:uncharacterized protein HemY
MTMSSAAALVTVIAALSAAIVSVINALAAMRGRQDARDAAVTLAAKVDDTAKTLDATTTARVAVLNGKADDAAAKLDQIHDLTNSNMTALKNQLAAALDRIEALEHLLQSGRMTDPGHP